MLPRQTHSGTVKNLLCTLRCNQEIAPRIFRLVLAGPFKDFAMHPGQFVMLKTGNSLDPLLRRPFAALARASCGEPALEIFYKVVGRGTELLASLPVNSSLEVLGPLGKGFSVPPGRPAALLVAGGMGIVPLRGLIEHLAQLGLRSLHVFLGAQSAAQLLFLSELRDLGASLNLATEDGSRGFHGLVTDCLERALEYDGQLAANQPACFACGPEPFLKAMAGIARRHRLSCQVSLEARMACGVGACLGCVVQRAPHENGMLAGAQQYDRVCVEGPVFDIQDIAW